MTNPWDRPPIPKLGDKNMDTVFLHVGRVMSQWEALEFELSRLYGWLGGAPDQQESMRGYGEPYKFRERADKLKNRAEKYFQRNCNQDLEGAFYELIVRARGYSGLRNDVAHGIAFRIDEITFFRRRIKPKLLKREHYALIPPLYAYRKADQNGLPIYAYTSREMNRMFVSIQKLQYDVMRFREIELEA